MTKILVMVPSSFYFFSFCVCQLFVWSTEQGLIIINVAVTSILAVIASGGSILSICNWFIMFHFETEVYPVSLSDMMEGNLLKSFKNQEIASSC